MRYPASPAGSSEREDHVRYRLPLTKHDAPAPVIGVMCHQVLSIGEFQVSLSRDEHLFSAGPKRVLSLDGGGIRGVLTLGMLESLEAVLRARLPEHRRASFVLSDYFDLIAGTSTGSIIATLLALGRTVAQVRDTYEDIGPRVFSKPNMGGQWLRFKFDAEAFDKELQAALGALTLETPLLRTGLLITCKRVDTGSAWIQANNPKAKYWHYDRTRMLRHLVRASTAAPTYFAPVELPIGNGDYGLFLDGAMSGQNNPSLTSLLYVLAGEHGLNWSTGDDKLLVLSFGSGFKRPAYPSKRFGSSNVLIQAQRSLTALIHESSMQALSTMQALSRSRNPFHIGRDVGGLERTFLGGLTLLSFERFDPPIDEKSLMALFGDEMTRRDVLAVEQIDNASPANLDRLLRIGRAAGHDIRDEMLPRIFDLN